jgi:hypothetical protein
MKSALSLLLLLVTPLAVFSQAPDTLWTRLYGLPDTDAGAVCSTHDGGFIIAGDYHQRGSDFHYLFLERTDAAGNSVWSCQGDFPDLCNPAFVHERTDGKIVVISYAPGYPESPSGTAFLLLDENGLNPTVQIFGQDFWMPFPQAACATEDGGYAIACEVPVPCMTTDIEVIRTDSEGNMLWDTHYGYGQSSSDGAECILVNPDHSITVIGTTICLDYPTYYRAVYMLRFSDNGDTLSSQLNIVQEFPSVCSAIRLSNGEYLVAGALDSVGAVVMRMSASGTLLETHTYESLGMYSYASSIYDLPGGDWVWAGGILQPGDSARHMAIVRCSPSGSMVWWRSYPLPYVQSCERALCLSDHGYLLLGTATVPELEYAQVMYVVRTQPDNSSSPDVPEIPQAFELSAYPNPFNGRTMLILRLARTGQVRLTLHDLLGREVRVLKEGVLEQGEHRIAVDASDLPSGCYFAHVQSGNHSAAHKLLLLK